MSTEFGSIWTHWHPHTEVLVGLGVIEGAYLLCVGPLRNRYNLAKSTDPRLVATFTSGILVIFVSLLSPLHILSDNYLFSAHMLQHILLTLVTPPLLILGTPSWLLRRLLRPVLVHRFARLVTHPIVAFVSFNVIFSVWHVPALYNLSVTSHPVHIGEHILFVASATLMWWPLTSTMPELPRLSYPLQMIYLFLLSVAQIIVFAPITFAVDPLYEWYAQAPEIWSIKPVVDQQIGGIIMKVGGGVLFMTLLITVFFRWFNKEEENSNIDVLDTEFIHTDSSTLTKQTF